MKKQVLDSISAYVNKGSKAGSSGGSSGSNSGSGSGSGGSVEIEVNDSNFSQLVYKAKNPAMIFFYAPWCGHCKKMEPEYNKLAKHLGAVDDIVIGKIDGTQNSLPHSLTYRGV